jgi:amino-acid N-acetyltransferase
MNSNSNTVAIPSGRCVVLRCATPADLPHIQQLLEQERLPTAGVADWLDHFWVAEARGRGPVEDGLVAGVAGLELYGGAAMLRSVAVAPAWRGSGLGRLLTERALASAQAAGAREVFLLTTTAERWFPRLGFACVDRAEAPATLSGSAEFSGACPESAVLMRCGLGEPCGTGVAAG